MIYAQKIKSNNFIINEEDYMLYENISSFYEDIQNEEDCHKDYHSHEEKSSLILDNSSLDNEHIEKRKISIAHCL